MIYHTWAKIDRHIDKWELIETNSFLGRLTSAG